MVKFAVNNHEKVNNGYAEFIAYVPNTNESNYLRNRLVKALKSTGPAWEKLIKNIFINSGKPFKSLSKYLNSTAFETLYVSKHNTTNEIINKAWTKAFEMGVMSDVGLYLVDEISKFTNKVKATMNPIITEILISPSVPVQVSDSLVMYGKCIEDFLGAAAKMYFGNGSQDDVHIFLFTLRQYYYQFSVNLNFPSVLTSAQDYINFATLAALLN